VSLRGIKEILKNMVIIDLFNDQDDVIVVNQEPKSSEEEKIENFRLLDLQLQLVEVEIK
jgi:hypothetical protein